MLKVIMDVPEKNQEILLAKSILNGKTPEDILSSGAVKPAITGKNLAQFRSAVKGVLVRDELVNYIVEIVRMTRKHQSILVGAGPRATQALILSSMTMAIFQGRDYVIPDDIKIMSKPVLDHRLILRPEYEIEGLRSKEVIDEILQNIAVPR